MVFSAVHGKLKEFRGSRGRSSWAWMSLADEVMRKIFWREVKEMIIFHWRCWQMNGHAMRMID